MITSVISPHFELLGSGSYAQVYSMLDQQRKYAVKIMSKPSGSGGARSFSSLVEIDICFRIRSIYLIQGCGLLDLQHYKEGGVGIVLPLRIDLRRYLAEVQPSLEVKLLLMNQLALGVAALHDHQFLHLDIKPDNCLCNIEANQVTLQLADYGLAIHCDDVARGMISNLTFGTPGFRPPECIRFQSAPIASESRHAPIPYHYDNKFDIWSMTMTCVYILTASKEFVFPMREDNDRARIAYERLTDRAHRLSIVVSMLEIAEIDSSLPIYDTLLRLLIRLLEPESKTRCNIAQVLQLMHFVTETKSFAIEELPYRCRYVPNVILGIQQIIKDFRIKYDSMYLRDLFFSLDLFVRLSLGCTQDFEVLKLPNLAIRLSLRYYHQNLMIPGELNTDELISLEFNALHLLQGVLRTRNFYDIARTRGECLLLLTLLQTDDFAENYLVILQSLANGQLSRDKILPEIAEIGSKYVCCADVL